MNNKQQTRLNNNKIAVVPILMYGVLIVIVALIGYFIWQSIQVKGLTADEVNALIESNKGKQVITQPSDETSDGKAGTPDLPKEQPQQTLTPSAGSGVTQCNVPSGFFSIVYARKRNFLTNQPVTYTTGTEKGDIAGIFKYTGNCPADVYLEAGIINAPTSGLLSLLPSELDIGFTGKPSNCDANVHYNGAVYHVEPNSDIKFRFNPENYDAEGTYPINVGAYWGGSRTGCLKYGGSTLTELHSRISFSDSYTAFQLNEGAISRSYEQIT